MTSTYEHQPLTLPNSIRVLVLEPARSPEAPIHCSLDEVDLDNITSSSAYEALSYVWGDRVGTIPILCHGKQLLVTPNCYGALVQLRSSFKRRRLFIDAICIDQRDETHSKEEREHQIASMGQVYEKARKVVIWLGKPHPATPRLFKLLRLIEWTARETTTYKIRNSKGEKVSLSFGSANAWIKRIIWLMDFRRDDSAKLEAAYFHLIENPWFLRVWTFQEQALANQETCVAVCGHHHIKYTAIEAGFTPLGNIWHVQRRADYTTTLSRGAMSWIIHAISEESSVKIRLHQGATTLARLLWSPHIVWSLIRDLESTVPQDKIFGVYAIFIRLGLNLPRPDYSKTAAEIFEATTREIIQQTDSLSILSLCPREASVTEGLPSWVPDWVIKSPGNMNQDGHEFLLGRKYTAARSTGVISSRDPSVGRLYLRGVILGKVDFVSVSSTIGSTEAHRQGPTFGAFSQACQRWCHHVATLPAYYCTGCPTSEAAKRTLIMNRAEEVPDSMQEGRKFEFRSFSECFDLMLYPHCQIYDPEVIKEDVVRQVFPLFGISDGKTGGDVVDLGVLLISYLIFLGTRTENAPLQLLIPELLTEWANYALMVLDTGHFARGLYICKEGDVVALLAGCDFPVALRPDGNGNYAFVAPLYVDGIMHGEAWPED
ncbi:heterokaryon incompatibility protein-domain-containing protein [Ustulina deusta]|nr:heterokaryon incompatibility protein-domain-containing protein [Ustulina deusta]